VVDASHGLRHARKDPDVFAILLDMKSRRGAALIRQRGLSDEYIRLPFVDLRHHPAARGESFLQALDDGGVNFHRQSERIGQRFARHVVFGRTESA
jgi:hypothetical protein